uniref:peroxidase n=1 Tax=Leersia perrieri TaxID=77586 RepID=A0A0D9X2X2_9ORYZ
MASSSLSVLLLLSLAGAVSGQLSPTFYLRSCPTALAIIRAGVLAAVAQERRMGASLLRLHFHDCFVQASPAFPHYLAFILTISYIVVTVITIQSANCVCAYLCDMDQGCDASVLLNDPNGEQSANPNIGSIRGFNVIDNIKAQLEAVCKQTVSCADILAVAARDSVVALGGPSWTVLLGRRDSATASQALANTDLPPPNFDVVNLTASFAAKGLSQTDMIALSGAHTIGQAQCQNFRDRLYNETNIDAAFATALKANCPQPTGSGDANLAPLDTTTPTVFDNAYYRNLLANKGLLHSDQVLFSDAATVGQVRSYASALGRFRTDFAAAMVKMGNISPLTGSQGQIRLLGLISIVMASSFSMLVLLCLAATAAAQLSPTFYDTSCPRALATIKSAVTAAVNNEARMGASLLRLHFHDCFGCDASVLLADTATFTGEQNALPNKNSLRGFNVIDSIKTQLEGMCKQTVSCADILAVAARDSVVALGGPSWTVGLGRRDSTTASANLANSDLPPPFFDLENLIKAFGDKGFTVTDMVALSGAHTIGQAQCLNFRDRIYNETNINAGYASSLQANCPRTSGDTNLASLDVSTPYTFDNAYYTNLMSNKGLLHSDQVLFNGNSTDNTVRNFASNKAAFSSAFASAMVKMANLGPLTGSQGQIRLTCSKQTMASATSLNLMLLVAAMASVASAQLSTTFYDTSCPNALSTISSVVTAAVNSERRMGASLIRLHFHDCFGCDASVLLSGQEQNAAPNNGSLRGFEVIDNAKTRVEAICNRTVSCADILAVAARDSVVALGGPSWAVLLGRRDSTTASEDLANRDLPPPTSDLGNLIGNFSAKGLDATDMVALSGAHTIGRSQCQNFRDRIYNEANINSSFATSLQANCPRTSGDRNLANLDVSTPDAFDNAYYTNLLSQRGLLHSDQVLFNNGSTDNIVRNFASNPAAFNSAFTAAMIKMGNISPLTGSQGQIRLVCSRVNSYLMLLVAAMVSMASAQLSSTFYDTSCPNALSTIRSVVRAAVNSEPRMGASLLRLHFHDCFVQAKRENDRECMCVSIGISLQGCDASVLLSGQEQNAFPNVGSLRGFNVIDNAKAQVEAICRQTVSCADILAVAARDSVVALGGPSWTVLLGRRDSTTANQALANSDLPPPSSDLGSLIGNFSRKNLSTTDMVALSGAHTIGRSQCTNFRDRIYNETNINSSFATSLQANCPRTSGSGDSNLANLDVSTPDAFDNAYYTNLMTQRGLLHSDQVLFNGGSTDNIVRNFASNAAAFSSAFTTAMIKMGNISPLTGSQGQIRLNCSKYGSAVMASASSLGLLMLMAALVSSTATAQLSATFYDTSCPRALSIIKSGVTAAVNNDRRMGASLLRLHFHDCFVQARFPPSQKHPGCDASVLLAGNERNVAPNLSLNGYGVIDSIKTQVEAVCRQTVSCADILTVAARDSVFALGGPSWSVPLGRRDSPAAASATVVLNNLPPPTDSLAQLISAFASKGLSTTDMVALSGAHTIGVAQCRNFRARLYNDTNIDSAFATSLKANCPASSGSSDGNLANLDVTTPSAFDNAYYTNLLSQRGLLHSDQVLFNNGSTDNIVRNFASNAAAFNSAFATAMVKMGNISPLIGSQGQIRLLAMASASCIYLLVLLALASVASAQLSATFYDTSCPRALSIIKSAVTAAVNNEPRMGASLLRLHFHDCFGCDASVLLAGQERDAVPNKDSLRGFEVIDSIKTQIEAVCNQTVSCADILTVAARDSVVALGGPSWTVPLGRRDSLNANPNAANTDLPAFTASVQELTDAFSKKGLTAQCSTFKGRIYNETNIDSAFATTRRANCPLQATGNSDANLANLDVSTPNAFDNAYYTNLMSNRGLLHSDQVLFNNGSTDNTVRNFASNAAAFSSAFAAAMVKMGNIEPKTGTTGQIRLACSRVNS